MKLPGIDLTPFMPLLKRGVEALERMADALEQANRLTLTTFLERVDGNLADLETENDAEMRPPPEPWGTTERTGSV